MRVRHGDAEAGPVEELAVVLPVAARDRLLGAEAFPVRDEGESAPLVHARVGELEEVGQRLGDEEAAVEARLQLGLERVERQGIADGDELRRVAVEPGAQIADRMDLEVLEVGVAPRLRCDLRHVELVVYVAVQVEAGREHGVHRLAGPGQRDRDMEEELTRPRVGDDRALVADDEIVET